MGRGIEHFRAESAKLDNDATPNDPYIEEAYSYLANYGFRPASAARSPQPPRQNPMLF